MNGHGAYHNERAEVSGVVQRFHGLVTYGPCDLDIAFAMSGQGYDAVKWAEGQGMLAELVTCTAPSRSCLGAALDWYREASEAARQALSGKPQLLDKLGVAEVGAV